MKLNYNNKNSQKFQSIVNTKIKKKNITIYFTELMNNIRNINLYFYLNQDKLLNYYYLTHIYYLIDIYIHVYMYIRQWNGLWDSVRIIKRTQ